MSLQLVSRTQRPTRGRRAFEAKQERLRRLKFDVWKSGSCWCMSVYSGVPPLVDVVSETLEFVTRARWYISTQVAAGTPSRSIIFSLPEVIGGRLAGFKPGQTRRVSP